MTHSMLTLGRRRRARLPRPRRLEILACTADSAALRLRASGGPPVTSRPSSPGASWHRPPRRESQRSGSCWRPRRPACGQPPSCFCTRRCARRWNRRCSRPCSTRSPVAADGPCTVLSRPPAGGGARAYMEAPSTSADHGSPTCIEPGIRAAPCSIQLPGRARFNPVKVSARDPPECGAPFRSRPRTPMVAARSPTSPHAGASWHLSHFSAEYKTTFGDRCRTRSGARAEQARRAKIKSLLEP